MNRYTCLGCGYVFDEEKGSPAQKLAPNYNALLKSGCGWHHGDTEAAPIGVAPGTKWEDVPEQYTCPSCGAAKDLFE